MGDMWPNLDISQPLSNKIPSTITTKTKKSISKNILNLKDTIATDWWIWLKNIIPNQFIEKLKSHRA